MKLQLRFQALDIDAMSTDLKSGTFASQCFDLDQKSEHTIGR